MYVLFKFKLTILKSSKENQRSPVWIWVLLREQASFLYARSQKQEIWGNHPMKGSSESSRIWYFTSNRISSDILIFAYVKNYKAHYANTVAPTWSYNSNAVHGVELLLKVLASPVWKMGSFHQRTFQRAWHFLSVSRQQLQMLFIYLIAYRTSCASSKYTL